MPAGSVPDDDYILAEWAGFGRRNLEGWLSVKDEVMSAWTRCSDGRWYHATLCEVARKQWAERQLHQWERECDRIRKANARRAKDGLDPLLFPPKPSEVSEDERALSTGCPADVHGNPLENALKGKGKGKEDILSSSLRSEDCSPAPSAADGPKPTPRRCSSEPKPRKYPYPPDAFATWYEKYPRKKAPPEAEKAFRKIVARDDTPFDALLTGIDRFWLEQPDVGFWPYPASWLNGRRWLDEPTQARTKAEHCAASGPPRVEFGGGVSWPEPTVRAAIDRWRHDPATWPVDRIGPPPGAPGCRVPQNILREAA